ncbi:sensor histidine kinase [Actinoallomurus vinaceus]|uniref:histidine kinase n=1 Tax=Actinoallomurus vinaceus TaxID=1080074 RepID=A0ABP8UQV4_9ACTN
MESPHSPSPPRRLPPIARIALTGCGVAGVALVLFATITGGARPGSRWNEPDAVLVAVTVVMALPLGWARHRPWPVLVAVLAEVAAAVPLGLRGEQIWPLFVALDLLVAFVAATRVHPLAAAVATLAVQESAYQAGLFADGGRHRLLVPGFLVLAVLLALSVLTAWLAGTLLRQRREYGERLRAQAEVQAVTAERLRIARELHDMVAHGIGVIAIQAGAGSRVIDTSPQQARDALRAVEATSRQTLQGLRRMLDVLRQTDPGTTLEEAAPLAGLADLDRLTVTTAAVGVTVDVRLRGRPRPLPPIVDHAAFRIVQESVTNVIRHAGTRHCRVSIDQRPDELHVEIVDAGQGGTADAGSGHGISGMRERAALLGGRLSAGPRPEGGFRVSARLPLPATAGRPR